MAEKSETVDRPQDWGKAVSAAYLWMMADEIRASARGAGVSERTMHRWVRSDWWPDACAEARRRWMNHIGNESLRTITKAIKEGNATLALTMVERLIPELAPPTKKLDVRLGVQGFIASLPPDEVRRIMALPNDERRAEVQRLIGSGDQTSE